MNDLQQLSNYPSMLERLAYGDAGSTGVTGETSEHDTAQVVYRFDLFVESADPRIAIFAACQAANQMSNFVAGLPTEEDLHLLLEYAGLIKAFPEVLPALEEITTCLATSVENINSALEQLADYNWLTET